MSGRLVILPKKSYCPWNPQNVERVLRDERLERERKEQEKKALQRAGSQGRCDALKDKRRQTQQQCPSFHNDNGQPQQRFSLFETEEKEFCHENTGNFSHRHGNDKTKKVGILPVFLSEPLDQVQAKKDAQTKKMQSQSYQQKQARVKYDMDPMKAFTEVEEATSQTCHSHSSRAHNNPPQPNGHVIWSSQGDDDKATSSQQRHARRRTSKHARKRRHSNRSDDTDAESTNGSDSNSAAHNSRRKHKRKHHRKTSSKRRHSSSLGISSSTCESPSPGINMDGLRKRRLERERKEKLREQAVIREAMGSREQLWVHPRNRSSS